MALMTKGREWAPTERSTSSGATSLLSGKRTSNSCLAATGFSRSKARTFS